MAEGVVEELVEELEELDIAAEGNNWLVTETDVRMLMDKVARHRYYKSDNDSESASIMNMCTMLFNRDYECQHLDNQCGKLCPTYPMNIIIPIKERAADVAEAQFPSTSFDVDEFAPLVEQSRFSRRHNRFPVPVILFCGKYICRSASVHPNVVSQWYEKDGRYRYFEDTDFQYGMTTTCATYLLQNLKFQRQIRKDVDVMRYCNIRYIFDLRMENRMGKRSEAVNASEPFYLQYYEEFKRISVPYPESSEFKEFYFNRRVDLLHYNWNSIRDCFDFQLPENDSIVPPPKIDFTKYKEWKVVMLTFNYFSLLLNYVTSTEKAILVQGNRGFDKTPLFITLLRLSLWADGLIHKSLNPIEMSYLTLAYDWYLFGHDLPKQFDKGYLIMLFCIHSIRYITWLRVSSASSDRWRNRVSSRFGR
ncbi:myotubularin-related protein 14-like isoform X2 [Stegodyphus dumicola]|uniref:myotubularin-related protein 14-like isoform X2 n=1 Tax=Stegodyphus dumicola TaxID=202533 RepID=UPI0015AAB53B|nr:myotubularin-related protein 14-like isoform X2 [Stegodyphus dumicola]